MDHKKFLSSFLLTPLLITKTLANNESEKFNTRRNGQLPESQFAKKQ